MAKNGVYITADVKYEEPTDTWGGTILIVEEQRPAELQDALDALDTLIFQAVQYRNHLILKGRVQDAAEEAMMAPLPGKPS